MLLSQKNCNDKQDKANAFVAKNCNDKQAKSQSFCRKKKLQVQTNQKLGFCYKIYTGFTALQLMLF